MLNQDKHRICLVLSTLFANLNYFIIKSSGKIIAKKNWWSFKRHVTTLQELAAEEIPTSMSRYSEQDAINYQTTINAILSSRKDNSYIIRAIFDEFTKFSKKYNYTGEHIVTTFYNPFTTLSKCWNKVLKNVKTNCATVVQYYDRLLAKSQVSDIAEKVNTVIESVEKKTTEKIDLIKRTVGQVVTGNAELDAKYQTIIRYISLQANVYCI